MQDTIWIILEGDAKGDKVKLVATSFLRAVRIAKGLTQQPRKLRRGASYGYIQEGNLPSSHHYSRFYTIVPTAKWDIWSHR